MQRFWVQSFPDPGRRRIKWRPADRVGYETSIVLHNVSSRLREYFCREYFCPPFGSDSRNFWSRTFCDVRYIYIACTLSYLNLWETLSCHIPCFERCVPRRLQRYVRFIIKFPPNARMHGYGYGRPTNARMGVRSKRVQASDRF